ncbi:urease subunit beta [Fontibacillus sp. BL9]|uniref:urease subunit beta n=1 Tax=Fontibacillus sp. BL9 TaxID=3389971 RepID=UPI00397874BD
MIPGEYRLRQGDVICNEGRSSISLKVRNCGDRPVQVGSHVHFYEVNPALEFPRILAYGKRLSIPAGTATRFEPGEEKSVSLTSFGGNRIIRGLNHLTDGPLSSPPSEEKLSVFLDDSRKSRKRGE